MGLGVGVGVGVVVIWALASVEVSWTAPPSCPAPEWTLPASARGRVQVMLRGEAGAIWNLEVDFLEPFQASRHLELESCAAARHAARVLLVLGLRGDYDARVTRSPLQPPGSAELVPTVSSTPPESPVMKLRLGTGASFATLPAVTPRLSLGAALRLGQLELGLDLRAGLPARFPDSDAAGRTVVVWPTLGAELGGCWAPHVGPLRLGACVIALAEWWQLFAEGVGQRRQGSAALLGLGASMRAALWLSGPMEVGLQLSGRAHLRRPEAVVDGSPVLSAGLFGLEAGVWVGMSL